MDGLTAIERGVLLAAVLANDGGERRLDRIAGEIGQRARRACRDLRAAAQPTRQRAVSRLTRQVLSPLPGGLEQIHPSWLTAALEQAPGPVGAVVSALLPGPVRQTLGLASSVHAAPADEPRSMAAALRWRIAQRVFSTLQPMDEAQQAAAASLREVFDWNPERLERALVHLGCLVLADQARRCGPQHLATLADRLDSPYGERLRQAPPLRRLAGDRALAARQLSGASTAPCTRPGEMLFRIGADTVATAPVAPSVLRGLGQRLARPLGRLLQPPAGGRAPAAPATPLSRESGGEPLGMALLDADRWARALDERGART